MELRQKILFITIFLVFRKCVFLICRHLISIIIGDMIPKISKLALLGLHNFGNIKGLNGIFACKFLHVNT